MYVCMIICMGSYTAMTAISLFTWDKLSLTVVQHEWQQRTKKGCTYASGAFDTRLVPFFDERKKVISKAHSRAPCTDDTFTSRERRNYPVLNSESTIHNRKWMRRSVWLARDAAGAADRCCWLVERRGLTCWLTCIFKLFIPRQIIYLLIGKVICT